jgi:hypothetical protein
MRWAHVMGRPWSLRISQLVVAVAVAATVVLSTASVVLATAYTYSCASYIVSFDLIDKDVTSQPYYLGAVAGDATVRTLQPCTASGSGSQGVS